jgi:hypothetical protein
MTASIAAGLVSAECRAFNTAVTKFWRGAPYPGLYVGTSVLAKIDVGRASASLRQWAAASGDISPGAPCSSSDSRGLELRTNRDSISGVEARDEQTSSLNKTSVAACHVSTPKRSRTRTKTEAVDPSFKLKATGARYGRSATGPLQILATRRGMIRSHMVARSAALFSRSGPSALALSPDSAPDSPPFLAEDLETCHSAITPSSAALSAGSVHFWSCPCVVIDGEI